MKRGTPDHPKAHALAVELGLDRWGVVGVLESLWHFTAYYAPAGDVGRFSDEAIAKAIGWEGDAKRLIGSLTRTRWLDRCACHRVRVHDWQAHCDQTVKRVLSNRNQQFPACYDDASTVLAPYNDDASRAAEVDSLPLPLSVAVAVPLPLPEPIPEPKNPAAHDAAIPPSDLFDADDGTTPGEVPPAQSVALAKAHVLAPLPWNREAAELWTQEYRGSPPKQFFAALKPLVAREGWERVRPALVTYMAETPAEYVNIAGKFVAAFGTWEARARGRPPTRSSVAARERDQGDAVMAMAGLNGGVRDGRRMVEGAGRTRRLPAVAGRDAGAEGDEGHGVPPGTRRTVG